MKGTKEDNHIWAKSKRPNILTNKLQNLREMPSLVINCRGKSFHEEENLKVSGGVNFPYVL